MSGIANSAARVGRLDAAAVQHLHVRRPGAPQTLRAGPRAPPAPARATPSGRCRSPRPARRRRRPAARSAAQRRRPPRRAAAPRPPAVSSRSRSASVSPTHAIGRHARGQRRASPSRRRRVASRRGTAAAPNARRSHTGTRIPPAFRPRPRRCTRPAHARSRPAHPRRPPCPPARPAPAPGRETARRPRARAARLPLHPARSAASSAAFAASPPFIFQLPTTSLPRIVDLRLRRIRAPAGPARPTLATPQNGRFYRAAASKAVNRGRQPQDGRRAATPRGAMRRRSRASAGSPAAGTTRQASARPAWPRSGARRRRAGCRRT